MFQKKITFRDRRTELSGDNLFRFPSSEPCVLKESARADFSDIQTAREIERSRK